MWAACYLGLFLASKGEGLCVLWNSPLFLGLGDLCCPGKSVYTKGHTVTWSSLRAVLQRPESFTHLPLDSPYPLPTLHHIPGLSSIALEDGAGQCRWHRVPTKALTCTGGNGTATGAAWDCGSCPGTTMTFPVSWVRPRPSLALSLRLAG